MKGSKETRLHLGCGETYLDGYTNIDYPQSEHTVASVKADEYKDLRTLSYPSGTIDEIRNHHVLEHFSRGETLGLLINWRRWLKVGGILFMETPDFEESARDFLEADEKSRDSIIRHIFGSQEAAWALHYDGWYEEKYRRVLGELGFEIIKIIKTRNNVSKKLNYKLDGVFDALTKITPGVVRDKVGIITTPNILCIARKTSKEINETEAAEKILHTYSLGKEKNSKNMLQVWIRQMEGVLNKK